MVLQFNHFITNVISFSTKRLKNANKMPNAGTYKHSSHYASFSAYVLLESSTCGTVSVST